MADRDPIWDALKQCSKEKFNADRQRFMAQAIGADDGGWVKHTEHHWSREVAGKRLDYWPSRKKYQFNGAVMRGNVMAFIKKVTDQGKGEDLDAAIDAAMLAAKEAK